MPRNPWYKCDPIALLEAVEELRNADQALLYFIILNRIYIANGPVTAMPESYMAQSALSRFKVDRAIIGLVEKGKLRFVGEKLMNDRAARELAEREAISEVRSSAAKGGGRPRKNARAQSNPEPKLNGSETDRARLVDDSTQNRSEIDAGMAENSHSPKAIAFPREEKSREETPSPLKRTYRHDPDMPDFGPRTDRPESVAEPAPIAASTVVSITSPEPSPVDKPDLISWIMQQARMVVPPNDMALVGGWVEMGLDVEREIKPTVCRMVAGARNGVRSMRYFDTELRLIYDVRIAKDAADRASFAAIRQRHAG